MNPKHAPALSTIPEKKVHSADLVECIKSIKQQEQMMSYIRDMEMKLKQATKSSL